MRIRMNILNPDSIDKAIARVNSYKNRLPERVEEILKELTIMGEEIVDYSYFASHEEYEVSCIVNGNSSMIIAEGSNVMFLEFGTGIYTEDTTEGMEAKGLPPIFAGSYSQSEGLGMFSPDHQFWFHEGVKYQGTLPMRGFYFASKEIKEQAVEVATKVFKK